jgi:DNA-binding winged helix-turn-helix (wHTH) protein/tetratricopeptide (TPR) repeat protein
MTAAALRVCYRFANFELQPDERRLLAAGAPVDVGPRGFDLLVALVERGGHLITKDELLKRVWPNLVVEENNLQVQVWALRKILGPAAIATVSGQGYRFTLEVSRELVEPPQSASAAMSVGVMPIVARSGDAATTQRAESLTRDLTSMLTRVNPMIRALPAQSALAMAECGRDAVAKMLNVRYLLEGELRAGGDAAIVSLRLINGATSEQIWSENVSLLDVDTPRGQMRAVRVAAGNLYRSLSDAEIRRVVAEHDDTTAMDYLLRAIGLRRTEPKTLHQVHEQQILCEEALRRDPNLVPALNFLSVTLETELARDNRADRDRLVQRMDELTSRAVSLDVAGPLTWSIRADVLMLKGQWDASIQAGVQSIRLDPDSNERLSDQAWRLTLSGRPEQALGLIDKKTPLSFGELRTACHAHILLGQYEQAVAAGERAKGLGVGDWANDVWIAAGLAAAYAYCGDTATAAAAKSDVLRQIPGLTIAGIRAKRFSASPDYLRLAEEHWYSGLRKAGFTEN